MTTIFIGIDLAWQSDKNHTGIVVARGDEQGATAEVASAGIASLEAVVGFVQEHATPDTVIAIDAPLVIRNRSGQRPCETQVSKRFGVYHAGAHSTNLGKYPNAPPCRLVQMLEAAGFTHDPRPHSSRERQGQWMFEVYPHPALVNLFRLDRIIKYKKGRVAEKQQGLSRLRNYLFALRWSDPPLQCSRELASRFFPDWISDVSGSLKHYEDLLDAYVCAYLALYYWRWGDDHNELIGDLENGYIVVPRRRSLDEINLGENNTNYVNPMRFVVDDRRTYQLTSSRFGTGSVFVRWFPNTRSPDRSIAYSEHPDFEREHGLGIQRIDVDTEEELRGRSGMVGEFCLRAISE